MLFVAVFPCRIFVMSLIMVVKNISHATNGGTGVCVSDTTIDITSNINMLLRAFTSDIRNAIWNIFWSSLA
jgi:hypothetical protein